MLGGFWDSVGDAFSENAEAEWGTINRRVVYISGPHGSGKSTLVERLKEIGPNIAMQDQLAHMESLKEMVERAVWRTALHCIEHRLNLQKAKTNQNQIIIGDRCYLDDEMYWAAFVELGWLTKRQERDFLRLEHETYRRSRTPWPERIILLCPPFEWNAARVQQRWESGEEMKWNEDNFGYLYLVNKTFNDRSSKLVGARGQRSVLVVRETDLDRRVTQIKNWLLPQAGVAAGAALVEAGRQTYRDLGGSD